MTTYVSPPGGYYFFADDNTPLVHVWSTDAGAFVVVGDATYLSWVVNSSPNRRLISGTSTGTAGVVRLQVSDTQGYVTGQIKTVTGVGGTTEANVTTTVSLVDATNIELQGTTWANAWTSGGTIGGAPEYQTLAAIISYIDNFNKSIYTLQQNTVTSLTITSNIALSNPIPEWNDITNNTADNIVITLPQMNVPGALPIGETRYFNSHGSKSLVFHSFDGTQIGSRIQSSDTLGLVLVNNTTSQGSWSNFFVPFVGSPSLQGDILYYSAGSGYTKSNAVTNGILYSTGTAPAYTASSANGVLVTDASGVPSVGNTITGAITVSASGVPIISNSTNTSQNFQMKAGGTVTGFFGSSANAPLFVQNKNGVNVALFNDDTAGGTPANQLTCHAVSTGQPIALNATGTDTDIDLSVAPKGAGLVKFPTASSIVANGTVTTAVTSLGPAGSHPLVQEWLVVKNSSGTARYVPLF